MATPYRARTRTRDAGWKWPLHDAPAPAPVCAQEFGGEASCWPPTEESAGKVGAGV